MADGRSKNKGIKGKAGRKPKAEELKVSVYALNAIRKQYGSIEEFWEQIAQESMKSKDHLKMLLEYAYGKPTQQLDHTTDGKPFPTPMIIAPTGSDE